MQVILTLATLALMIFSLVNVIMSDEWQVKHLPKIAWVLLIIFLPIIGSILWLILGKDREISGSTERARQPRSQPQRPLVIDDDVAIENEIAYHENQARIRRLEAELKARRDAESGSNG